MIDQIFKLAGAAAAAAAAWYVDKRVKEKTGKHIHEHAVDYVKALWKRLKNWAAQYLAEHKRIGKIYLSAVNIAAAAKRARNAGMKAARIKIFGQEAGVPQAKVIREEEVEISQIDDFLQQAKSEPVLALRN
jgi:MoxR-like ATPase